jgi:DNA helicase HerA-like ATPase
VLEALLKDALLKVGAVCGIDGRKVYIRLDKNKNSSDLLFNGDILKNIAVGSYIEIRKGFLSIIGKAEGEKLEEDTFKFKDEDNQYQYIDKNIRTLVVTLSGFIDMNGRFIGGIKELPLIGNEAFILTEAKIHTIHNLLKKNTEIRINIAKTDIEEVPISLPVDGLFNSHIAIFGNTGSGKSNTLASLYQAMIAALKEQPRFKENCKIFVFDFNGEYTKESCISKDKTVYNLSTKGNRNDKIPMDFNELMDIETLSILLEATEKTQKPFLKRALNYYKKAKECTNAAGENDFPNYFKNILLRNIKNVLKMTNKDIAFKMLDYLEEIISFFVDGETEKTLRDDIEYHNQSNCFYKKGPPDQYFSKNANAIEETNIYLAANGITETAIVKFAELDQFFFFIIIQLIYDLYRYKIQIDHIVPVINRFKAKQTSIEHIFKIESNANLWVKSNIVVLNLHDVNLDMRKTVPLLMAKHIYSAHKNENNEKSLTIVIDEAHNILSKTSFRETEDWKDYRLETFEEIIKEGRKFGVFVTIASQRPNDISETIISQAHNYFIHQLINQRDLQTIGNAVSYIDRITEEAIPTLPVGTCVFSGIATPMPLKLKIEELPDAQKPDSNTLKFGAITGFQEAKVESIATTVVSATTPTTKNRIVSNTKEFEHIAPEEDWSELV